MKIEIDDYKPIAEIQEEFNRLFPYLRLEFFAGDDDYTHPSSKKFKVTDGETIKLCRRLHNSGVITIFPEMSVSDLEDIFKNNFGLSVQVLRKSGNTWLEISHSDTWSLSEQNRQGDMITSLLKRQEEKRKNA